MRKNAIIILAALFVAVAYSVLVNHQQPGKVWDWLNTLIGSTVSFLLAVLTGLFILKREATVKESSERERLQALLSSECSNLLRILGDSSGMEITLSSGDKRSVLVAFVQPLVIEKSALSGLFGEVHSENLLHLASTIRMLNFKSTYFMGLLQSRAEERFLTNGIDNIEQTRLACIENIRFVAKQMAISIHQDYPD